VTPGSSASQSAATAPSTTVDARAVTSGGRRSAKLTCGETRLVTVPLGTVSSQTLPRTLSQLFQPSNVQPVAGTAISATGPALGLIEKPTHRSRCAAVAGGSCVQVGIAELTRPSTAMLPAPVIEGSTFSVAAEAVDAAPRPSRAVSISARISMPRRYGGCQNRDWGIARAANASFDTDHERP
jgi:hypothetical protein